MWRSVQRQSHGGTEKKAMRFGFFLFIFFSLFCEPLWIEFTADPAACADILLSSHDIVVLCSKPNVLRPMTYHNVAFQTPNKRFTLWDFWYFFSDTICASWEHAELNHTKQVHIIYTERHRIYEQIKEIKLQNTKKREKFPHYYSFFEKFHHRCQHTHTIY